MTLGLTVKKKGFKIQTTKKLYFLGVVTLQKHAGRSVLTDYSHDNHELNVSKWCFLFNLAVNHDSKENPQLQFQQPNKVKSF